MDRLAGAVMLAASVVILPWLAVSAAANLQPFAAPHPLNFNATCSGAQCAPVPSALLASGTANATTFQWVLALVAVGLVGVSYVAWRKGVGGRYDSFWNIPGFLLGMGLLFLALLAARSLAGGSLPQTGGPVDAPSLWYLSLSLLVVAGALTLAWTARRSQKGGTVPSVEEGADDAVAAVFSRGAYLLRSGGSPRAAVIECYRSMVALLAKKGVKDAPSMTAREFEAASEQVLHLGALPVHRLTSFFERARYSDEAMGASDAAEASSVLEELAGAVGGGRRQ